MKKTYYKLTDQKMQTYNGCKWEIGVEKSASGTGELCTSGWIHVYDDPLLAVILNPIHAAFSNPRMFVCGTRGRVKTDRGLKFGVAHCTLVEEIVLPQITLNQRSAFGILCAMDVCSEKSFKSWAENWLSNKDRSADAAASAAASAATDAATYAANAAASAADYAAYAANAANAAANAAKINLTKIIKKAITIT
jgi:hypothetical protein